MRMYASMIPSYCHSSVSSLLPLDLNEDQNHEPFTPNHQPSSFSSLSFPILFNPPDQHQDQEGSYYGEPKPSPSDEKADEKVIPSSGSWDHSAAEKHESSSGVKLTVWKKEDKDEILEAAEDGSMKWMPSKMRMMRKMMVSDQTSSYIAGNSMQKFGDQQQPLSPLGTDNNCSTHINITVRVCSDCHTTKTPLWRSGPRGPKSLCNACGIRQRKARRAMAAAAAASENGTILVAAETSVRGNKIMKKEKKSTIECAPKLKKKRKNGIGVEQCQGRKKFGFEDLTLRLSKNLARQQVFPQDEKEAAILLMALSYGLVHG